MSTPNDGPPEDGAHQIVDALRSEVERLREDKEMLDWLDHRTVFIQQFYNAKGPAFIQIVGYNKSHEWTDIRAAINAARGTK